MANFRLKNVLIAKLAGWFPALGRKLTEGYRPTAVAAAVPWQRLDKPVRDCRIALVTTAGIHHNTQQPFDMQDADGDPTFRVIDASASWGDFTITHDYYDHADADKDPNIILPLDRLKEFVSAGEVGELAPRHYSFMGHIVGRHLPTLVENSAVTVAEELLADQVDLVILSPG